MRIRGLYYNHTFTYEEINSMIESILFSKTIDTESANKIIEKIENNLTTKFYKKRCKEYLQSKRACACRQRNPA